MFKISQIYILHFPLYIHPRCLLSSLFLLLSVLICIFNIGFFSLNISDALRLSGIWMFAVCSHQGEFYY